jgi:LysR family hydrogen peroxide-inducible transcriptional activator
MTLLPYLHTLDLSEKHKENLRMFEEPSPAREVSLIHYKSELKLQIIEKLHDVISGVIRGAIAFQNVKIISPKSN